MSKQEALNQIEDLLVNIEQMGDELKQLFRENFPEAHQALQAYDAFNLTGSWNRYDTTIDSMFQALGDGEYDMEEDEEMA